MADRDKIEFRLFNSSSFVIFEYNPSRRYSLHRSNTNHASVTSTQGKTGVTADCDKI